ncbi:hypothetical protein KSW79_14175, partial [Prevotella copri]|uniref:hypothetical protein n=1 Tax=Segatella copri TaxID=165179 RepID=UPI001C38649B
KWVSILTDRKDTRAHWLWEGVKNGVKKWAKADGGGALTVWSTNKLAGVASGGTALLAGAAPDFDKMCTYKITYPHFQAFSKNNL